MRKIVGALLCLAMPVLLGFVTPASAVPGPVRSLSVTGTATELYPAFDPTITRYGLTTDATTAGTVTVTATTSDPAGQVTIAGNPASGPTPVTGLSAGDEIPVVITDTSGQTTYSVIYLPAGFPKLTVTTGAQGSFPDLAPGLVAVTLFPFGGTDPPPLPPGFEAIVDRNGVPVYAHVAATLAEPDRRNFDLKQQPTGEITMQRPTAEPDPATGYSVADLDPLNQFQETSHTQVVAPLKNTDFHDSLRLPDGSTVLMGYEPNAGTGKIDATVQKLDAAGKVTFQWTSTAYAGETMADATYQGPKGDYAHVNSVVSVEHGDLIVSFRHLSAAYRIATVAHDGYQPGDVIWKLGGRDSSFTFVGDGASTPGPCGQHTVSELPNGHILIFDNGSDGLCLDPSDPLNPGVTRGFTRVTEYALDTAAHTATLVWSYNPGDKYSAFAGSARRTANGNTLIAWAADSSALATEVDQADNKLWELTVPAGGTGPRYISYRAELIAGPQIVLNGPADGATFVQGASVPATAGCTDWVSHALASCTKTGIVGGALDTSTVGTHTWSATGVGGAGVASSESRRYTVRSPLRRADGMIRRADTTRWKGNNIRGSAVNQTVLQAAHRGTRTTSYWLVQNDGERGDAFRLAGTSGSTGFRVHYFTGGRDVTAAVVAGTFRTTTLTPGRSVILRVVITPTRSARVGAVRTFTLRCTSVSSSTAVDRVAVAVTARR